MATKIKMEEDQLRLVYARIEEINEHFEGCCASLGDRECRYDKEYEATYAILVLSGMPEEMTPCGRDQFEAWLRSAFPARCGACGAERHSEELTVVGDENSTYRECRECRGGGTE